MITNDGGPAFPFKCQGETTAPEVYYGMSLRDYFAAKALQGILANHSLLLRCDEEQANLSTRDAAATFSYALADSMLAAR